MTLDLQEEIIIHEEVSNKAVPRTYQIVAKVIAACKRRGVEPVNFGSDNSGAGGPFNDVLASEWSPDFLRVNFGGGASNRIVDPVNKIRASDRYKNRVTELWYSGKDLLRGGQLKGVGSELSKEMCSRRLSTKRAVDTGLSLLVESKQVMKARTGASPDSADAVFVLIEVSRERLGLETNQRVVQSTRVQSRWKSFAAKTNRVYNEANVATSHNPINRFKFHGYHPLR
jgi:hypothetical protein